MSGHKNGGFEDVLLFARQTPQGPLLHTVVTAQCEKVLAGGYPWRLWAVTQIAEPGPDGLPSGEESANLAQDEEELVGRLPGPEQALHCGSLQHRGHYVSLIYSVTPDPFETGSPDDHRVFTSAHVWDVYCREDRKAEFLHRKFIPTPKERRRIGDRQVLEALEEAGDRPEIPRPIRFFALFPTQAQATAAGPAISEAGFAVTDTTEVPSQDGPRWSVMFEKESPAGPGSIEQLSSQAQSLCESTGGEYDGWECAPVSAGQSGQ